jgi:hypothetical protein
MGVEINLYPVRKAQRIDEIDNLEEEIDQARDNAGYLYKIYHDLLIVLQDAADPYEDESTLAYKAVMGNRIPDGYTWEHVGFVPFEEVEVIYKWLKELNIGTPEGFENLYNNRGEEAREELEYIGTDSWEEIYPYAEILVKVYDYAHEKQCAMVVLAE